MLDELITKSNKQRKTEKAGLPVAVQLKSGVKIFGILEAHLINKLLVRDWKEENFIKEIHRATIERFFILIQGGKYGAEK
jgi:hypothetical protein